MSKRDFLDNLRVARNLFVHGEVTTDSRHLDPAALSQALARAAIWLTPSAVKGFRADDFQELGAVQQCELTDAVQEFRRVATEVAPDAPATHRQFEEAKTSLEKILAILDSYLPSHDDATLIQDALGSIDFPSWVVNWDYEIGSDEGGDPAIWVTIYADEKAVPPDQYGSYALEMISKIRSALTAAGIRRWPYIRLRTALEHKVG